jgi:hypothetical protein
LEEAEKIVHSQYVDRTPVYNDRVPERLPIQHGNFPIPDPDANNNPHTRLRWDVLNERIYQARTFENNGVPVKDIDFTRPTRPNGIAWDKDMAVPHQQRWEEVVPGRPSAGYKRSKNHEPLGEG